MTLLSADKAPCFFTWKRSETIGGGSRGLAKGFCVGTSVTNCAWLLSTTFPQVLQFRPASTRPAEPRAIGFYMAVEFRFPFAEDRLSCRVVS